MTLDELTVMITSGVHLDIEVHAVNPMVYVVYQQFAERRTPLKDARGRTVQFRSRFAALHALAEAGVRRVTFISSSCRFSSCKAAVRSATLASRISRCFTCPVTSFKMAR